MDAANGSAIIQDAQPFDADQTRQIVAQFHRDGYCFLKGVLTAAELRALREAMERKWADPRHARRGGSHPRPSLMRMYRV